MTESSPHVVNPAAKRLTCSEVWGGNSSVDRAVELPGLAAWVYSSPLDPAADGGDVYYFSVCSHGTICRVALADVAGHGGGASSAAAYLRSILRKHLDNWDQSVLMSEINDAFWSKAEATRYATAAVLGFQSETGDLIFSNAGHPPPLWYRNHERSWYWIQDDTPPAPETKGLPLGMLRGTAYSETGVSLAIGDILLLYTDGITEVTDNTNSELGCEGLLRIVGHLASESPAEMVRELITRIQEYRGDRPREDDDTLILLQRVSTFGVQWGT